MRRRSVGTVAHRWAGFALLATFVGMFLSACASGAPPLRPSPTLARSDSVPRFAHIVVLMLENHSYGEVLNSPDTPYLRSLAADGAVLTRSYAITHPSEPNYLALFSGSTHGLRSDPCPRTFRGPNLASALQADGRSFAGYSEQLPRRGWTGCEFEHYTRLCNPWMSYPAPVPSVGHPMSEFPTRFADLPSISFVVPDLRDDMHSGTPARSDAWVQAHLGAYARWSVEHDSLLIITADEDDRRHDNRIPTVFVGARVRPGHYSVHVTDYNVLATLLEAEEVHPFGAALHARPVTQIWTTPSLAADHGSR